jgi:hypothetical protein
MYPNYENYVSYPEMDELYRDSYPETSMPYQSGYKTYPETITPYQGSYKNYPVTSMPYQGSYKTYPGVGTTTYQTTYPTQGSDGDRFLGGALLAPFLLGGLTGAAVAPYFMGRPYYPYGPACCPPPYYGYY